MRAGVLRPHVDGQHLGAQLRHTAPVRRARTSRAAACGAPPARARSSAAGTLMWMSAAAPTRAAVAAGQGHRRQAARLRRRERREHVGRPAARRDAEQHVARRGRAPPPAARRPGRSRSRWRSPSGSTCPSSGRSPPAPARSRSKRPDQFRREVLGVRGAAAVAAGQDPPAAPEAPPPSPRPPRPPAPAADAASAVEARGLGQRRAPRPRRRRSASAPVSPQRGGPLSMVARNCSSVTCDRSVELHRHVDLDRIVLAQRVPFPVLRRQQAAQVRVARRTRRRTDPRPRARGSPPTARCR